MASAGRPRGCGSDPPTGSDRAWGSLQRQHKNLGKTCQIVLNNSK